MASFSIPKLQAITYGGDYNPEQWPESVWQEDMRLMRKAGVNLVSIGIFSWSLLQPDEHTYRFDWLDRLMDLLAANGIYADLATATASPPAWMAVNYDDVLPVDERGAKYWHGSRQQYCPNSPTYRKFAKRLTEKLAERYRDHPALAMWHVNNEYMCHIQSCYCDRCAAAFRAWLAERYGSLDELNDRWGTNFWSQRYYRFEEIMPPRMMPTIPNPGQTLDYARFMSDSFLACYLAEQRVLKEITPDVPVITNFMTGHKPADYFEWAKHLDIVTWDSYPDPMEGTPIGAAMWHDLMRSLKGGQPFILMEQVTTQVNWRDRNALKRPGVMRLWSYQAVAHGADGIMFFQWRQAKAGAEKWHGAMVSHTGDENSRAYQEVRQLGGELKRLSELVGARTPARTAIVFDWHNWWAVELPSKPLAKMNYLEQVMQYYRALYERNIAVDFVQPNGNLSGYDLVIAPLLYMVEDGVADHFERFVSGGGTLLMTYFSGMADENDRVLLGEYPVPFRKLLGLQVEEFEPLPEGRTLQLQWMPDAEAGAAAGGTAGLSAGRQSGEFGSGPQDADDAAIYTACEEWIDIIRLDGAEAIGVFAEGWAAGKPAVTRHTFGQGAAYYIGTKGDGALTQALVGRILAECGIEPPIAVSTTGVEITERVDESGTSYFFLLNHNEQETTVNLPTGLSYHELLTGESVQDELSLAAYGAAILRKN